MNGFRIGSVFQGVAIVLLAGSVTAWISQAVLIHDSISEGQRFTRADGRALRLTLETHSEIQMYRESVLRNDIEATVTELQRCQQNIDRMERVVFPGGPPPLRPYVE